MSLKRTDTKESSDFWAFVERTAAEVATWPAWKPSRRQTRTMMTKKTSASVEIHTLAYAIAEALFTNGAGQRAERLVLAIDGPPTRDLGGFSHRGALDQITKVLAASAPPVQETPPSRELRRIARKRLMSPLDVSVVNDVAEELDQLTARLSAMEQERDKLRLERDSARAQFLEPSEG